MPYYAFYLTKIDGNRILFGCVLHTLDTGHIKHSPGSHELPVLLILIGLENYASDSTLNDELSTLVARKERYVNGTACRHESK
jgi:hypothetical protein